MKYENPTIERLEDNPISEQRERHPAYAQISASRVSGNAVLYGSDFRHQHFVTIAISASELNRSLSSDWPSTRKEYIEVALSEAQWASFVSTLNTGSGTQCTLQHKDGKLVPQIPDVPHRREQFKGELQGRLKLATDALTNLQTLVSSGVMRKRELLDGLGTAIRNLTPNLDWVAEQFDEHMERTTEHAKIEIAAFTEAKLRSVGMAALKGQKSPFIEEK